MSTVSEGLRAIRWGEGRLRLLDQRALPETRWIDVRTGAEAADAITAMVVRGAPAIAITAAYGLALAARAGEDLRAARDRLAASRPTAVNLRWALERMEPLISSGVPAGELEREAVAIHDEDVAINRRLGAHGAGLLGGGVLTICNTGSLATGGHGTALGMVRSALEMGRELHLFACETRPYDQGARLTTYECSVDAIPCTLIADSMAGALLASGRVSAVVVGADRVARNGDVANKIGTYTVAVLCRHHRIPLLVAAPWTTIDLDIATGADIPIEQRAADEVRIHGERLMTPPGMPVRNPAFDVTPAALVSKIITERGVYDPGALPQG